MFPKYTDEQLNEWKRKKVIRFLTFLNLSGDDKIKDWESIYNDKQGSYNYEEDEE